MARRDEMSQPGWDAQGSALLKPGPWVILPQLGITPAPVCMAGAGAVTVEPVCAVDG